MTLDERIAASLIFYASGEARWRQPNPELRADAVLAECREEISRLRADVERSSAAAQRAAVRELAPSPSTTPAPRQEQAQRPATTRSPGTRREERPARAPASQAPGRSTELTLPMGRSKGVALVDAETKDLEWVLGKVLESIDATEKAKWKRSNEALASAIEKELNEREERGQ
jgi:hypothetical protein